jgi:hypothetical protein
MPFVFDCPECRSSLKTGAPPPAGRAIQCPKCRHVFTAADTDVREESPAPRPSDAEDDFPDRRPEPAREEEPPRRRRDAEDDYDRPRRRDEEEDNRPRRRTDEEDDYDRPRRRRDEDYDRPRRRPAARGGPSAAIVVLALLFVGAGIAAVVYFLDGDDDDKNAAPYTDGQMHAFAPPDTAVMFAVDVETLVKQERFARMLGGLLRRGGPGGGAGPLLDKFAQTGLTEHDVARVFFASPPPNRFDGSGAVYVIRFTKPVDRDRLVKALDGRSHRHDGKKYYSSRGGVGHFFFAGDRMLIGADRESTLKDLLNVDVGKTRAPQYLFDLAAKARGEFWMALDKDVGMAAVPGFANLAGGGGDTAFDRALRDAKSVMVSIGGQGDRVECRIGVPCAAAAAAGRAAAAGQAEADNVRRFGLELAVRQAPPNLRNLLREILTSVKFRSDGPVVVMEYTVGIGTFEQMADLQQNGGLNQLNFKQ